MSAPRSLEQDNQPAPESQAERQLRVEALADEYLERLLAGETPDRQQLLAAHPELADLLGPRLELVELMHRVARAQRPADSETASPAPPGIQPERAFRLKCPHCGNGIQLVDLADGEVTCGSCGSSFHVDARATTTYNRATLPRSIGKFEVLEQLGRGAFGTVYKARDPELQRLVAVKVPRTGSFATAEEEERFLREARAAAQLSHPGIVPVLEIAHDRGVPYIVSEYVEGLTLADVLTARRPNFRESAELTAAVADALDYAHRQKIVHRDIKPSNLLLDAAGRPHITDFGLARRGDNEITVTLDGQILGTPAYMSPEQAAGDQHHVDARSDVYSLGVVLYELLTGELPFRGNQRMLLHQVIHDEPRPPRSFSDRVPRDLETICLKAMAKTPGRRYGSAVEMADDLRRFLNNEAIRARRVGRAEKLVRWARRNPMVAALTAAVALLLVAVAAGEFMFVVTERRLNRDLSDALDTAERNHREADARAKGERQEKELARLNLYTAHMHLAQTAWEANDIRRVRGLLDLYRPPHPEERDPRGFEWYHLDHLCHLDLRTLNLNQTWPHAAFTPDCQRVAVKSDRGAVRIYEVITGQVVFDLSTSGTWFAAVVFSTDGKRLAAIAHGNHSVTVWDARTGKEIVTTPAGTRSPREWAGIFTHKLAFSHDGRWIASAEANDELRNYGGEVIVWDSVTGKPLTTMRGEKERELLKSVAFSPDDKTLATRSSFGIQIWEMPTGRKRTTIESRAPAPNCGEVVFSPDGHRLACAGSDQTVQIWDATTSKLIGTLRGHTKEVNSISFSPDGRRLASGSSDSTIRVWDIESKKQLLTLRGHESFVTSISFNEDGWRLISVDRDGALRLWDSATSHELDSLYGHVNKVDCVAFSADGRLLASGSRDQSVRIWDVATRRLVRTLSGYPAWVRGVAFSPDASKVAAVGDGGFIKVWNVPTGQEFATLEGQTQTIKDVAFSPEGKRLATRDFWDRHAVRIWDLDSRRVIRKWQPDRGVVGATCFAFRPDSRQFAFGDFGGVRVWDMEHEEEAIKLKGPINRVESLVYTPDGRYIVAGDQGGAIRFLDADSGKISHEYNSFAEEVQGLAFVAGGRRLVSIHRRGLKLWDTQTRQEVFTLQGSFSVGDAVVTPDGSLIAYPDGRRITILEGGPCTQEALNYREAKGLVHFLFDKGLTEDRVLEAVRAEPGISDGVRRIALAQTDQWHPDVDVDKLNKASWKMVLQTNAKPDQYQIALKNAEMICRLVPDNGAYLNTLGVAQYRVGQYQAAVDTLLRADRINRGIQPDLVFLAMAYHRLGQKQQAQTTLTRLRKSIGEMKKPISEETRAFLREAETLIEGNPRPGK